MLRTPRKMSVLKIASWTAHYSLQDNNDTNAKPRNSEDELDAEADKATLQQKPHGIPHTSL